MDMKTSKDMKMTKKTILKKDLPKKVIGKIDDVKDLTGYFFEILNKKEIEVDILYKTIFIIVRDYARILEYMSNDKKTLDKKFERVFKYAYTPYSVRKND
jgi:hypothetical protein